MCQIYARYAKDKAVILLVMPVWLALKPLRLLSAPSFASFCIKPLQCIAAPPTHLLIKLNQAMLPIFQRCNASVTCAQATPCYCQLPVVHLSASAKPSPNQSRLISHSLTMGLQCYSQNCDTCTPAIIKVSRAPLLAYFLMDELCAKMCSILLDIQDVGSWESEYPKYSNISISEV